MDLGTRFPVVESVDDSEKNNVSAPNRLASNSDSESNVRSNQGVEDNVSALNKLETSIDPESKVRSNGSYVVENGSGSKLLSEMKSEVSSSPPTAKKGVGLKKWRRIRRDVSKFGDSSFDAVRNMIPDASSPGTVSSKRVQVYAERSPKGEGSTSSTKAMVKSLDGFVFLGDTGEVIGKSFAAGTDLENSEDRSSKSSTAASAPRVKYERPVVTGSTHGRSTMSGKNLIHSAQQRVQQGKSRSETTKKARGERVRIEKENSQSSLESDLRSSNFVVKQDNHATSNGMQRGIDYDGETCDEVQGSEHQDRNGIRGGYNGDDDRGYEDFSAEGVVADSPWDQEPIYDPLCILKSVEEALEKEVLKFKEIGKDVEEKLHETESGQFPYGEGGKNSSRAAQSEVLDECSDVERQSEDIIKQKIEAEIECLVISEMVQNLKVTTTDQITLFEEQNALASEQTKILDKLGDAEGKASVLKKEAEKLERYCEDIAVADETLKLQNRVCKYTFCFFLQLVIFLLIIGVFYSELSPSVELVPT